MAGHSNDRPFEPVTRSNRTPFESNLFRVKQHFLFHVKQHSVTRMGVFVPQGILPGSANAIVGASTFRSIVGASTSRSNDGPAQKTDLQFRIA